MRAQIVRQAALCFDQRPKTKASHSHSAQASTPTHTHTRTHARTHAMSTPFQSPPPIRRSSSSYGSAFTTPQRAHAAGCPPNAPLRPAHGNMLDPAVKGRQLDFGPDSPDSKKSLDVETLATHPTADALTRYLDIVNDERYNAQLAGLFRYVDWLIDTPVEFSEKLVSSKHLFEIQTFFATDNPHFHPKVNAETLYRSDPLELEVFRKPIYQGISYHTRPVVLDFLFKKLISTETPVSHRSKLLA